VQASDETPTSRSRRLSGLALRHPWLVGVGLLLLVTLSMRLYWGWRVGRRLAALNAQLIAMGQPPEAQDIRFPHVPDDQNAWLVIVKAAGLDDMTSPSNSAADYPDYPPYPASWQAAAQKSEISNAPVLVLARQVRDLRRSQPRTKVPSLMDGTFYMPLSTARQLANTVADSAIYCHLYFHDDLEAVERLRDMLGISRATSADETLVGALVTTGLDAMATHRILIIAPGLTFDRQGTRDSVKGLIAELLDESHQTRAWPAAIASERLMSAEYTRHQSAGTWALKPLADDDILAAGDVLAQHARAVEAVDAQTFRQRMTNLPKLGKKSDINVFFSGVPRKREVPRYSDWFEQSETSALERAYSMRFRDLGDRRCAAVSLAARLFRADHGGQFPQTLAELVPAYLPAVPKDPYHADGRPLGYTIVRASLPDGSDRPLVSYDADFATDGPIDTEPMYGWHTDPTNYRKPIRQYRDLARWSPAERRFDIEQRQKQLEEWLQWIDGLPNRVLATLLHAICSDSN
jgi:hypothetical protein